MQDDGNLDMRILGEIENWVLDEMHSYFSPEHLRLGHTLMGEMCSRLGHLKDVDDPMRPTLLQKARWFLTPIARDTQSEPYLVHTALQILKCL